MNKPLSGEKIAVLVANGFNEKDLIEFQRMVQPLGAQMRIVSMSNGLVNSWNGEGWGLNFAADTMLSEALAADFSMLIVPGGQRSAEKLKLTAHTRRFIGGFVDTGKSVVALGEALDLLAFVEKLDGRTVAGPEDLHDAARAAGAEIVQSAYAIDGNLMTSMSIGETEENLVAMIKDFLVAKPVMNEAA